MTIANKQLSSNIRRVLHASAIIKDAVDGLFQQSRRAPFFFKRLTMPSYDVIYSVDNCKLANKPFGENG